MSKSSSFIRRTSKWWLVVAVGFLAACGNDEQSGPSEEADVEVSDAGHNPQEPTHDSSDVEADDLSPEGGTARSDASDQTDTCSDDASYDGFAAEFFTLRCNYCHSVELEGPARIGATEGVDFDTEADTIARATAVQVRVLEQQSMPPGIVLSACEIEQLQRYLDGLDAPECVPDCADKACGSDGCGAQCGVCADGESCVSETGTCEAVACVGDCIGKACGDDGCGESCGECASGLECDSDNRCACAPQCDGKRCGDDGCGSSCGDCEAGAVCTAAGECACVPQCDDRLCGDDGCGGSCGACPMGLSCDSDGSQCSCVPDCTDRACGDDGCGGSCGDCPGRECNTRDGVCVRDCTADCNGRECGDDGCGGSCGECSDGAYCSDNGACECAPNCVGRACGDDGCGGVCGECTDGSACDDSGHCACEPDCTNRECGDDGCGGSCGECSDGLSCGSGQCSSVCVPSCGADECGDDGCGGSCGSCPPGTSCQSGGCEWPSASFDADVYPIFEASGCGSSNCHGGARPAEALDLSTAAKAYSALVNKSSGQCGARLLVDPGSPGASYLVDKVLGTQLCSGSKMPKSGAGTLSAAEVDTLSAWIGSGAAP